MRCDSEEICSSFFSDLKQRLPSLFDKPLKFTSKSLYWQKSMPSADAGPKSFLSNQQQTTDKARTKMFSTTTNSNAAADKIQLLYTGFRYEKASSSETTVFDKPSTNPSQPESGFGKNPIPNSQGLPLKQTENVSARGHSTLNSVKKNQNIADLQMNSNITSNKDITIQQNRKLSSSHIKNHLSKQEQKNRNAQSNSIVHLSKIQQQHNPSKVSPLIRNGNKSNNDGNIIDIPDSPFDQLVPDDLLLLNSSLNQNIYQDTTVPKDFRDSQKKRDVEIRTDKNPRGFSLVDESLFEGENQLVPDKTTCENTPRDLAVVSKNSLVTTSLYGDDTNDGVVPSCSTVIQQQQHKVAKKSYLEKHTRDIFDEDSIFPKNDSSSIPGRLILQ